MTNPKSAEELLQKYLNGKSSPEERAMLESWYNEYAAVQELLLPEPDYEKVKKEIFERIPRAQQTRKLKLSWAQIAAAAMLFCVLGISIYYSVYQRHQVPAMTATSRILPGGNKAVLTLANGKKISLTDSDNGQLAEQAGIKITKTADGQLVYTVTGTEIPEGKMARLYNEIETPEGGQYQVNLPDGTKVWLNSSSKLQYPLQFSKSERLVHMSGECYFEVAHDLERPFRVGFSDQLVEVLGTHFNINDYPDEHVVKTTLLEGRIRLKQGDQSRLLLPGQQAAVKGGTITVNNVDTDQVIAWKNGDFAFEGTPLKTILRQVSRWYNVEIEYQGTIADTEFGGSISRKKNINEVLKVLELTRGVHFKIEGRRVLVMP